MCKSEQDLLGGSVETKASHKTDTFSTTSWIPKEGTNITSIRNNQEVNNNNFCNHFINDRNNTNDRGKCRKRWKSETELRKISNNSNLFLGSLLTEVVGEAKVCRYLKTGEPFSNLRFITLSRVFSTLVTFVSVTYAVFFLYLLTRARNPHTVANSLHWVFPSLIEDHSKELLEDLEIGKWMITSKTFRFVVY